MAFSDLQAGRFRHALKERDGVITKRMMGGLIFMLNGNMVGGVDRDPSGAGRFMFRVGPDGISTALARPGCTQVSMGGRIMKGFVFVADCDDAALESWVELALAYVDHLPPKA